MEKRAQISFRYFILALLAILAGGGYLYVDLYNSSAEPESNLERISAAVIEFIKNFRSSDLPGGILYGNGQVEGTEVRVSAEVSGRVIESTLVEGRAVKSGDLLVRLDDADLKAHLAEAEAERKAVEANRSNLLAQIGTWTHHFKTAETDLARYRKLGELQVVPRQQVDNASDREREAQGRLDTLNAQVREAEEKLNAAARHIDSIRLDLEKTTIKAPISGTVLNKGIEMGEFANPGRVIAVLVDLARLELKIYIPERDVGKVRLGDPARLKVDAFPVRFFEAAVARIEQQAEFTPRDIHMPEERTRLVFGLTLALSNPQGYLKPGMPADAWIKMNSKAEWPPTLPVPR